MDIIIKSHFILLTLKVNMGMKTKMSLKLLNCFVFIVLLQNILNKKV